MDASTPPSLDLACPQAEADIEKYVHMCVYIYSHMISYAKVTIYSQCKV